ncbi:adenylyltransferase and sulfurtransferase MOCS3 isoform X1 [Spea bombifrons]|uniref:adenylyltransferase and sulfurtransferase MOCS3 isoform X1 n=1 Tax=Spea bombifrons TaxID=233779 RepID=UPI00234AED48|nr:adenylyltransferase and sulfurtransferase MOCS3 isoform X1 [Spea bombifrons]
MASSDIIALREEIKTKEEEIQNLKEKLAAFEKVNVSLLPDLHNSSKKLPELTNNILKNSDILRYSRQLILPEFGIKGQLNLSNSSVLVIGCGGLGCPLAQYLAASGIGRLGLVDYDIVEMSNLHRQILHFEKRQGMPKSVSVVKTLKKLNSAVEYVPYHVMLNPDNVLELIQQYDVIADCSDNVPTRYLVNDACVVAGKPLVSASALRWQGQLTVYNHQGGPCYRCLFPTPPPPETVTNCADGGVLGIVPGIIGCMQALEVLKIAAGMPSSYSGTMLLYDALDGQFRNIKIRAKKLDCGVCGINSETLILEDYETFCGSSISDKCRMLSLLPNEERLTVQDYKKFLDDGVPHVLIDVRPQVEVDICHLPHSTNISLTHLEQKNELWIHYLSTKLAEIKCIENQTAKTVVVICKHGNDSQKAVKVLKELSGKEVDLIIAKDVQGGLMAWAKKIDPTFPQY